mgnify:CR=1 FL=1
MFRFIFLFTISFSFMSKGYAQIPIGKWRNHFSFNEGKCLSAGNSKIYCATSMGVIVYNRTTNEIDQLSKINGLTEVGISAIAYLPSDNIIAIGYESGNVDLVYQNRVVSIPDIKEKSLSGSKTINGFLLFNDKLYTATDFGIVVIDPLKREVKDTYFLGENGTYLKVKSVVVFNNRFWAATAKGLLSASVTDPLLVSFDRWTFETSFINPDNACIGVAASSDALFALENNEYNSDILWRYDGNNWIEVDRPYAGSLDLSVGNGRVLVTSNLGVSAYSLAGSKDFTVNHYSFTGSFKPNAAIFLETDEIAIADNEMGLVTGTISNQISVKPAGPVNNKAFSLGVSNDRVVATSGGYDASYSNMWNTFVFHKFSDEQWGYYADWNGHDAVTVAFNPKNTSSFFVGSWGHGVYQFQNDELIDHFTPANSTLQSVLSNSPFCRVSGLAFDNKGNLWVSNAGVQNPISVRKADGTWVSFPYSGSIGTDRVTTLHYSEYGSLWLLLPQNKGVFVLNPGQNIDSKDDDLYRRISPSDRDGKAFNVDINSLAFDKDNYLWLGTSQGVLLSYNPNRVFDGGFYFQKIKIPDVVPGLAVYLLETETVTSVAIDGGNRKWFGTSKSGLYLFSSDGTKEVLHFNSENSPLPSNNILDVKIHPVSGEVFVATDKGLVSYRSDANEPLVKFGKVYSYPNPVPPGYNGKITITGLVEKTIVKITDINGNLIYETMSEGGMANWDGRSLRGNRVASGVYLVLCADSKGEQTAVTKILFIK